jgi:hypothetical protein
MPIHEWARVDAGLFHAFRHRWLSALGDALNAEALPEDHFALIEEASHVPVPRIATSPGSSGNDEQAGRGVEVRPHARGTDRIAVRHQDGRIVAAVEIVCPGDKSSGGALRAFVDQASKMILQGIHLLVVDLFPPGEHDPQGIHKAIWDELEELEFEPTVDRPLTVASYDAGPLPASYVEPAAVGDVLPEMPLFLRPDSYVPTPLEATYQAAWDVFPAALKGLVEP